MTSDRENYCRLIGLNPNKESSFNYDAIEKKIAAKETKWKKDRTDKQNDLDKRFQIGKWLDLVPDMRKVMKDPVLKSKEFEAGLKLLKAKASRLNKDAVTLHDGSKVLLPGTAEGLVKKLQWEGVTKEELISLAGIRKAAVPSPVSDKIITAYKGLRDVNADTPIELLNELIKNSGLEINVSPLTDNSPLPQIRSAFEQCEKRVSNVRQEILPNQDSYIQSLRSLKLVIGSEDLAILIKYGKCMKVLAPAKLAMDEDYSQPFTREYIDDLLNRYLKSGSVDSAMAIAILEEYCVKKKYLANFSTRDSKLTTCPECGAMVETGDNVMHCSACGFSIKTRCPQCNTNQSASNASCIKCGFDFKGGLNKAKDLEKKFRTAISYGMVDEAADCLAKIERVYSTYQTLPAMKNELKPISIKYSEILSNIDQMYAFKRYNSLQSYIGSAKIDFPKITNNIEISRKYEESLQKVSEASKLCERASISGRIENQMPLYVAAVEACPDHPIAKAKMKEHPPESPADANAQIREGKVLVKFAIPPERQGMTFCIYRGRDTLPVVTEDTIPLAEIPGSVFLDKAPEPGVDLYYSIYTKRWGILSRDAASYGPVTVYTEVENITIEPIEGGLRLTYEKPRGCSRVRIWRKEGTTAAGAGEEVELQHDGGTVIDDYGLKGGATYHYLFVAEYRNKGKVGRSMGTDRTFTTTKLPEPVKDMEIRWNRSDGSFTAKWKNKDKVVLYSSPTKVKLTGRTVKIEDLNAWMHEIQPNEVYADGVKFSLPDGTVQFIYPMIPAGKVAVRGKDILVANLKPFRDVEKRISGSDCDITMTWPTGAESAILAVMESAPAAGPDDLHAERLTVTREAYNTDKKVRVPMGNSKKRIITMYAVYDVTGEKMTSRGICFDVYSGSCTKVSYRMKIEKSRAESKVDLSIETSAYVKELPAMSAVLVKEGIPLKRHDGESIWSSGRPVPLSGGKVVISFTSKHNVDLPKVRVFFDNDEDYNTFRFIHPIYRER
ncbi:MAG: zinc ribbon domain-containing protein [Candidatus Methanoplasma sp.]|jgi:predicted RNA-binding Zn-ribbon protein involved in translation (DUF1610 family)|nr:zinc ribbon domain-containing protein [Candidatus Methanoplasma sp.]